MTSSPKHIFDRTQEGSFIGYTSSIAIFKWWYPHTKKLKYCSSATIDEDNSKFGKEWSPAFELMAGKYFHLSNIKIYILDHPFIKEDICEATVTLPPRDTYIGVVDQYCENHNMSYISQSTKMAFVNVLSPI